MIPLSALVKTEYVPGPDLLPHFNGFPAAQVTGGAAAGYSSGAGPQRHGGSRPRGAAAGL